MSVLAPDAPTSQLHRNRDICLTVPKANPAVADFLFYALETNPLHPSYPLRADALRAPDELLCINLFRRISETEHPFYRHSSYSSYSSSSTSPLHAHHPELQSRRGVRVDAEDIIFFPVAFVDGFIFGYFSSDRTQNDKDANNRATPAQDAMPPPPPVPPLPVGGIDAWTERSFGRFVFHTASHAFYMSVHGGDPPYIGLRVKLPRGSGYTDFLDVVVPPGDYGRSRLPTESPLIVSTPKFPNTSMVRHDEHDGHNAGAAPSGWPGNKKKNPLRFLDEVVCAASSSCNSLSSSSSVDSASTSDGFHVDGDQSEGSPNLKDPFLLNMTANSGSSVDGMARTPIQKQRQRRRQAHKEKKEKRPFRFARDFQTALDRLADSICKNSFSSGLRSDSAGGAVSFTGHCEYFISRAVPARTETMRLAMLDSMQLAMFFTMMEEPYVALHQSPAQRRAITYTPQPPQSKSPGAAAAHAAAGVGPSINKRRTQRVARRQKKNVRERRLELETSQLTQVQHQAQ